MERCPQCRARLKGRTICGRCEADLTLLLKIEEDADILARRSVKALLGGDVNAAVRQATVARDLHATPFHSALAGFLEKKLEHHRQPQPATEPIERVPSDEGRPGYDAPAFEI